MQTLLVALPHEVSLLNHTPMTITLHYGTCLCYVTSLLLLLIKKFTVYIDMLQYTNFTIPTTRVTILTSEFHLVLVHIWAHACHVHMCWCACVYVLVCMQWVTLHNITSRPIFIREMWFIDCSCVYVCECACLLMCTCSSNSEVGVMYHN